MKDHVISLTSYMMQVLRYLKILSRTSFGRIGTVDDVANAVLYFASDESLWTRAVLAIDGGASAK